MNKSGYFIGVVLGWYLWQVVGLHIVVAAIISFVVAPLVNGLLGGLASLFVKNVPTDFLLLNPTDRVHSGEHATGMYVLLFAVDPEVSRKEYYDKLYADAIEKIYRSNAVFRTRFDAIIADAMAVRVYTVSPWSIKQMPNIFAKWRRFLKHEGFKSERENIDMFVDDLEFTPPTGTEKQPLGFAFFLLASLPVQEKNENKEATNEPVNVPAYPAHFDTEPEIVDFEKKK